MDPSLQPNCFKPNAGFSQMQVGSLLHHLFSAFLKGNPHFYLFVTMVSVLSPFLLLPVLPQLPLLPLLPVLLLL